MKLNGTPRHYMPLSQSQSDDEENASNKGQKFDDSLCKSLDVPHPHDKIMFKDEISNIDPKTLPMSLLRTVAFILSLCMCVAFITIFIWLLPCKPVVPGINNIGDIVEKWSLILQNISFTTDIILTNASGLNPVILFGYSISYDGSTNNQGILAFQKTDGKKLWQIPLYSEPTSILCDFDANNDGLQDCLVIGLESLMTTIDINKGSNIWYIHNHSGIQDADNISLPVILADCDCDLVPDIVVSYELISEKNIAYLALVSGRTGEIIGSLVPLQQCGLPVTAQFSLEWQNRTIFMLFCSDGKKGNLWFTHAEDICNVALNKTKHLKMTLIDIDHRNTHFSSHVQFKTLSPPKASFVMAINGSKFLVMEPEGSSKFKIKWLKTIKTNSPWRVVAHGNYMTNENSELLLLKSNNFSSQVIGLNLLNGQELWSASFNGSIVTSVLMLQNIFDGIVLKMVKPVIDHLKEDFKITNNFHENRSETIVHKDEQGFERDAFKTIEEGYILLQGGKPSLTKKISSEEISQYCDETNCKPDIYASRQTAFVTMFSDGTVDLAVVFMNASSLSNLQTVVKLLTFKLLKHSTCMYELDS